MVGGLANREVKPAPDTVLLADKVVNAPVLETPEPIGPGDAINETKPAPETVLVADRVVNAPAAGVVPPIAGGAAR